MVFIPIGKGHQIDSKQQKFIGRNEKKCGRSQET